MKPSGKILMALLWLALILLRVVRLDSDAYARLSWSSALLTDEGFYVHNARNLVLFGHARTDEFNNALIMPLLHGVQVLVFSLCGVGAIQARSISVLSSLLTLAVFFCGLRRAFSPRVAWLGLALLGLDPMFTLYNRLALMDTPACLPLACAFYAWTRFAEEEGEEKEKRRKGDKEKGRGGEEERGRKGDWETRKETRTEGATTTNEGATAMRRQASSSPLLLFSSSPFLPLLPLLACGLSLGTAYLVRGLAALVVPVPFLLLLLGYKEEEAGARQKRRSLAALAMGLACVLLPYLLLWYLPNHRELARVNAYYMREQLLPRSGHALMRNVLRGLCDWQRGMMPFLLKHSSILLVLGVVRAVTRDTRHDEERIWKHTSSELYLVGWLITMMALTWSISYAPSRYYVLLYPPLAGLAALQLDAIVGLMVSRKNLQRFYSDKALLTLLLLSCSAGNIYWYTDWLLHLSYRQRDADRWLAKHLPPDSVLIGAVSLGLCLDNRFRCVNVIEGLCNDIKPVEKVGHSPRYIVILDRTQTSNSDAAITTPDPHTADRWKERYWLRTYPELVRPERRLVAFPQMLRPFFTIGVYPVPDVYTANPHSHRKQSGPTF